MFIEFAAGTVGALTGLAAYGVRGRSSNLFGPSVWRGSPDRRTLALTFDDGPSESTGEILDILERHRARATFFQCGMNVRRLPDMARAVAGRGHEIGNHSHSHTRFYLRSSRTIQLELERAQETIAATTGAVPVLFRAPFGARWFGLRAAQRRLSLMGVMWTAIGRDWTLDGAAIARRLLRKASAGAIFCLHDGREIQPHPDIRQTTEALRRLLPELESRGFRLETVSELICPKN